MSDLPHAKRAIQRATYTPIKLPPRIVLHPIGRAWEKWGYIANLAPTAEEVAQIERRWADDPGLKTVDLRAIEILRVVVAEGSDSTEASLPLRRAQLFADVATETLVRFGGDLLRVREDALQGLIQAQAAIIAKFSAADTGSKPPLRTVSEPDVHTEMIEVPGFQNAAFPGGKLYRSERSSAAGGRAASAHGTPGEAQTKRDGQGTTVTFQVRMPHSTAPVVSLPASTESLNLEALMNWAIRAGVEAAAATRTLALTSQYGLTAKRITLVQWQRFAQTEIDGMRELIYGLTKHSQVEPVGYLHLERLGFIPAGIERGELVYSVPLSPGEEVNIAHKEWSNTSEEFQKIVTDALENYSEEGVTEKSELTQSTSSQDQHSTGFNTGVTASGGFGPVTITATVGFNVNDSATHSEQQARTHSNTLTRKASSRSKQEHKTSFKVSSASGTEDQAVRLIKNPFPDKATRIDYYQLIRKWRVDLYRYGIRLTYDLVIPEPGSDVLDKIIEINEINDALQQGFASPDATQNWARFDLTPSQITSGNMSLYEAQYGTTVDPPPAATKGQLQAFTNQWPNEDASMQPEYHAFEIQVPDGYMVAGYSAKTWYEEWDISADDNLFRINTDLNAWLGGSGMLPLVVATKHLATIDIEISITCNLLDSTYLAWQQKSWAKLRDAAQSRYEENRQNLRSRLDALMGQLGADDALSLRKLEREEVMKGMLRWMFGPGFTFFPKNIPADLYVQGGSVVSKQAWSKVLAQGEVIKFLHQAIEWENMLYFLYPYFWSHPARWDLKKHLDHPDFMHRAFLRAGSARVVLTIRPGFEADFVSFLETGTFAGLPAGHPYLTIAEEIEAFAQTNYPGISPANPVDDPRPLLTPRQRQTWGSMQIIMGLLEKYNTANGRYPTSAEGLAALAPFGAFSATDSWSNPFVYTSPGAFRDYDLVSLGADGQQGGDGEAADITSWAEASLIGQWYEYTPTSALDIAFNEILPNA